MLRKEGLPMLFCLMIVAFVSCKKETDNRFDCEIQGIENIDAKVGDTKILDITVAKIQGAPENVILSLKNVPTGVSYSFETNQGTPNYTTTLTISVANTVKMGTHVMTFEAKSENLDKTFDFNLTINDSITMVMKVYDGSKWAPDKPVGELADSAIVQLYKDSISFARQIPYYSTITDVNGIANFYHLQPGTYFFTVEKLGLSNIASKKTVGGRLMGFATTNIDKYGQLQYRDQDGDGKITDADRVQYDMLILYDKFESGRIVWIGH
jgi:hypothetical protein